MWTHWSCYYIFNELIWIDWILNFIWLALDFRCICETQVRFRSSRPAFVEGGLVLLGTALVTPDIKRNYLRSAANRRHDGWTVSPTNNNCRCLSCVCHAYNRTHHKRSRLEFHIKPKQLNNDGKRWRFKGQGLNLRKVIANLRWSENESTTWTTDHHHTRRRHLSFSFFSL